MTTDRYVSFGDRVGVTSAVSLPLDNVPASFRGAVWNFVQPRFSSSYSDPTPDVFGNSFWLRMAKDKRWDMDEHRSNNNDFCAHVIKKWLLDEKQSRWDEVYDFLQQFCRWARFKDSGVIRWEETVNQLLYEENSPYRFINHLLAPIISEAERAEVTRATNHEGPFALASEHIQKALKHFSQRPKPDLENAVKEAVCGLETGLTISNGKRLDIGPACSAFRQRNEAPPALMQSASQLFGYASERDGVRHGKKTDSDVEFHEAQLVIICASAWVNFIASKAPA